MNFQSINQFTLYNLETNNLKPKIKFFKSNNNKDAEYPNAALG